jgi:hypothetical membrane protein
MKNDAGKRAAVGRASRPGDLPLLLTLSANGLFWSSVFGFAALRSDYSHATDAVSELGVWGAPNMWGFNLLGYVMPGVLLAAACWIIARRVRPRAHVMSGVLAWSGLAIVLAGLAPGDLRQMNSLTSILHVTGSLSGILLWLPGVIWLGIVSLGTRRRLAIVCFGGLALMVGAFSLYIVLLPGIVQRLSFGVLFGWSIAAALATPRA